MRLQIPLLIILVMGIFTVITSFIPAKPIADLNHMFRNWYIGIITFFIFLGTLNLANSNIVKIKRRQRDWQYSIILLVCLGVMLFFGMYRGKESISDGTPFMYLYFNVQYPLGATMYSLLAFFITSASFRAFRARNKEAVCLLVAALIIMLGRVPVGSKLWSGFPGLTEWIMNFPNAAAKRGIRIGIDLGLISMALRMILGIERSYMQ